MNEQYSAPFLKHAIELGFAKITGEGKSERIHYLTVGHSERWADPEEKVRAEFWAELILKYEYRPEHIRFEVVVPRRTPSDKADLVIYSEKDAERKSPWFVIECKRADISDAEFAQAIEQACGNRTSLGAKFRGVVAGLTRRFLSFEKHPPAERDKNHIQMPVRYGKPSPWRFYKGGWRIEAGKKLPATDLPAVPREELRAAIRKCHQSLWDGGRRSAIVAFGEFCKLVFVKHRDEKNPDIENGEFYYFQRKSGESADELAARIHQLYAREREQEPDVFTDQINVEPPVLAQVVEHIEGISLIWNNSNLANTSVKTPLATGRMNPPPLNMTLGVARKPLRSVPASKPKSCFGARSLLPQTRYRTCRYNATGRKTFTVSVEKSPPA
ncbi:MAG: type I restriction enzyme HsdR N-terminal domain-containing protein [Verrucomicrobiales bacterium]|jgi:type I restriction enzyme M protein|nr:type I restriction enzyme HsdR N-terminal domain-containing protein [Verrucomicrobiales bacterium]